MRTITVVGHGSTQVVPDTAVLRVGAAHQGATLAEALAGASSAGEAVVAVARRHVDAARVSSRDLTVWPAHDHQGRPAGFQARQGYTILCPDLSVAGTLVTELAAQVGDRLQVDGVTLEVADGAAAEVGAREVAYADALARASHLAGLAGVRLGEVQAVVEGGAAAAPAEIGIGAMAKRDVSFEPGESTVSQSLTVTWSVT
ncbi:SIMPL domain-containing protein [Nocardioides sp.]|uniref:SIMPL domain-containing protein n=1 Tax=Nocardioides sp. TaxID=35761 RepID=UPI00286BDE8B|nr:SIMPL domain-containing protein [Nocardioides sp.]